MKGGERERDDIMYLCVYIILVLLHVKSVKKSNEQFLLLKLLVHKNLKKHGN